MDLGPTRFQFRCSSLTDSFNAHFQDSQMTNRAAYYGHRSLYVDCLWASLLMGIAARGLLMGSAAYYGQRCLLGGSGRQFPLALVKKPSVHCRLNAEEVALLALCYSATSVISLRIATPYITASARGAEQRRKWARRRTMRISAATASPDEKKVRPASPKARDF